MLPTILQPKAHEKQVKAIRLTTGIPYKSRDNSGRPCFALDAEYTLDDDTTTSTRITSPTKKGLPDRLASRQTSIARGQIHLDNGFEVHRMTIG